MPSHCPGAKGAQTTQAAETTQKNQSANAVLGAIKLSALLDAIVTTYGAVDFSTAIILMRRHFELEQTDAQLLEDMQDVLSQCRYAQRKEFFICHRQIANPMALMNAIASAEDNQERDYAEIPMSALMAFKDGVMPEYSTHHASLKQWLVSHGGLDAIGAQIALNHAMVQMNLEWGPDQVVKGLPEAVQKMDPTLKKQLMNLLTLVYQHTPKWTYKGHTPNSVYVPADSMKRPEGLPTKS